MKKDNFKISMPELKKMIAEEYDAMKKETSENASRKEKIEKRLKAINEELDTLPETLEEVEATGKKKLKSTGWTGDGEGDMKYGEKFEKIGSHLKEDDELEGEIEVGGEEEIEAPEMEESGYFEEKFAELGKELDEKLGGEMEEMEMPEMEMPEGDMKEGNHEEGVYEANHEESVNEEAIEEVEVVSEEEEVNEEEDKEEKEEMNEDLEEPIEGETPAQDQDARFNDYMDKDKHVKESVKPGSGLLSEGFSPERKTALSGELSRMAQLAKIGK